MQFIDLKAQYAALKDEINANIQSVLDAAQFISGPQVKELEQQLQESAREVRARALGGTPPRLGDHPKHGLSCPEWP